jgi:hypothetical protein
MRADGFQVTFPGTDVTAPKSNYDPRERPWYKMYTEEREKLSPIALDKSRNVYLTAPYADITPVQVFLVRTMLIDIYLQSSPGVSSYTLAIDLYCEPPMIANPSIFATVADADLLIRSLNVFHKPIVTLILALMWCILLYYCASFNRPDHVEVVNLQLRHKIYANDKDQVIRRIKSIRDKRTKFSVVQVNAKSSLISAQKGSEERIENESGFEIEKTLGPIDIAKNSDIRGYEIWEVTHILTIMWKFFGFEFHRCAQGLRQDVLVTFGGAEDADITDAHEDHEQRVDDIVSEAILASPSSASLDSKKQVELSNWPKQLENVQSFSAAKSQRKKPFRGRFYYLEEGRTFFKDLYANATVRAVIKDIYLEDIFVRELQKILTVGDKISRIIVYEDKKEWNLRLQRNRKEMRNMIERYNQGAGRVFTASLESLPETFHDFVDKDFALLGNDLVVVTEDVYEQQNLTFGRHQGPPDWKVGGYVSWRKADVIFYNELYELLEKVELKHLPADV